MNNKNIFLVTLVGVLGACGGAPEASLSPHNQASLPVTGLHISRYVQGAVADARGDEITAAAAYAGAASSNTTASVAMRAIEKQLLQGNVPAALTIAQKLEKTGGDTLLQWVILAVGDILKQDTKSAQKHIDKAQKHLPDLVQLQVVQAYLALAQGASVPQALKHITSPDAKAYKARLAYHTARMHLRRDNIAAAQNSLQDARTLEKGALFTTRLFARTHPSKAPEAYAAFREKHKQALLMADVTDDVFLTAEKARSAKGSSLREDTAETLFGLAVLLWAQGAEAPARQFMALALHLWPDEPFMPYYAGILAEGAGQYTQAHQFYTRMAHTPGLRLAAATRLAALARTQGHFQEGIAALQTGLTHASNNTVLLAQLAQLQEDTMDYRAAIRTYQTLLSLTLTQPQKAKTLFARGAAWERLKQYDKAAADFKASLKITPNDAMVLNYLGYMWVDSNQNLKEGLVMLKRAHKLAPNSAAVLDSLGWAYYKRGQYAQALLYVQQAVTLEPEDGLLQSHLGDIYAKLKNKSAARKHWQLALELHTPEEEAALKKKLSP